MRRALVPLILAAAAFAPAARAQTIVYDPTAVGRLVQQYEAAVQQLEQLRTQVQQGQTLLNSLNTGSAVNTVAAELSSPALRAFLPNAQALVSAAQGKMTPLGALGASANAIRAANRVYTPPTGDPVGQDLEAAGNRAAISAALGQQVADVSTQRLQGLQTLQANIGQGDARAALDLQARLQAEQAMLANEQVRLQGLAMSQAAQDRLQGQRDRERAAQNHADAEAAFRSGLQP